MDAKTEIARKRRRVHGYDTVDDACNFIKQQFDRAEAQNLYDSHKVSIVPYMGSLDPGARPGRAFNFIGSENVMKLIAAWFKLRAGQELLLVGPKGAGKTCLLRAFANLLYVAAGSKTVCVCIWNMDRARKALCSWILDALKFAYKCANTIGNGKYDEALDRIESLLARLQDVKRNFGNVKNYRSAEQDILLEIQGFLGEMADAGDTFTFIVDGVQVLDTLHHDGQKRAEAEQREQTLEWLADIVKPYKVVWGLSPSASALRTVVLNETSQSADSVILHVQGFTKDQRQIFLEHSALGAVVEGSELRKNDMDFYAGFHPHFLDALDDACIRVASEKYQQDEVIWSTDRRQLIGISEREMSPMEVAATLEDEEDWVRVLHRFIENPPMSSIKNSAQRFKLRWSYNEFLTVKQVIAEDGRYAIDDSNFCSGFIKQIYMEEFGKKIRSADEQGPWLSYAKLVLQAPQMNWSELGWLCERLCDDVISRRGMHISTKLVINRLSAQPFSSIPKSTDDLMDRLLPGCGHMYIPIQFNFGKVDAVIFYRDMNGQLHLIGLQFTTSQPKHQHSKDEFMAVNALKQWVPNVVQLQQEHKIVLDFVFVCTASEPKEKECKGTHRELRNGAGVGTVDHISHVIGFDYALEGIANNDVLNTLKEMARLREKVFVNLDGAAEPIAPPLDISKGILLGKTDAFKLKRADLDAYAIHAGIDPHVHPTKKSLLDALICANAIVLHSQ